LFVANSGSASTSRWALAIYEKVRDRVTKPIDPTGQPDEVMTTLIDATTATIDDVRALGVSEEELSDEEIIDALQEAVTAGIAERGADQ
jgi:hypothetical protein